MRRIPLVHLNFPHLHDNKKIHLHNNNMTCTHTRMDRHMIYKWYGDRPQPQRHTTKQPLMHRDTQPLLHRDTQPLLHRDTQPLMHRDTQPLMHRHRVAGTHVPTVPTVPIHINSSTSAVPVTYRHIDIEWLVPVYQQYPQYQYIRTAVPVQYQCSTSNI